VSGQTVTCTITGLPVGASVTVDVQVTPTTAGNYTNSARVSLGPGITDPVMANNTAASALAVTAPASAASPAPTRQCIVPKLPKIPVAAARTLLRELGCTVRTSTRHSGVKRGLVTGVKGKTGTFPYQQAVTLIVSSGPKPKKHKHL
jgi:hypothetical protein